MKQFMSKKIVKQIQESIEPCYRAMFEGCMPKNIKNHLKYYIEQREIFIELIPLLRKINYENVSYSYPLKEFKPDSLTITTKVGSVYDEDIDILIEAFGSTYTLYINKMCIIVTENIKHIKSILKGLLRI